MIGTEIFSPLAGAVQIVGLCFKLHAAKNEIAIDKQILDEMSSLASKVSSNCRRVSTILVEERRQCIEETVQRMRELLEEVEKAGVLREEGRKLEGKSDGSVGGVRRIMWVFKDKSTAETYRPLLLMWYSKLLIMESELASRWTEPTNHGGLNSVTISLEERKHTETTTVAVAPSFPMHELESKEKANDFYTERSSYAQVSSASLPVTSCSPSQVECESILPDDISSMQSSSSQTSLSSLTTYPFSYAECDTPPTDDYISSQLSSSFQTRELPNPLSATSATPTLNNRGLHPVSPHERSNPLPTYTTAPRERCLGPGTSSEKRNSSPSYPMSSPNNGDKNSNPSQELISPLPTYSTAPRGRKGLELGSSVRTSSSHPYPMSSPNSGDQDSNPRKASTNSLPTYSTLPRANSLPVCTMSSPNSADRDSNPRQESTSYLPTYSTAPRANPFTACTTPHSPHSAAERRFILVVKDNARYFRRSKDTTPGS